MVEALKEVLPVAHSTDQSIIVLLDWYSAHRSDAVINFIEGRGHVILWHGGGCTPFTQVNDTHLHAMLQQYIVRLENKLTHAKRTDMHLNHNRGIPTLFRTDICDIAITAWRMIPHKQVALKGYVPPSSSSSSSSTVDSPRLCLSLLDDIANILGLRMGNLHFCGKRAERPSPYSPFTAPPDQEETTFVSNVPNDPTTTY